jgi:hypothetical protein
VIDHAASPKCRAKDLRLQLRPVPGDASASEQLKADIEFTNASARPCSIRGYPTVSFAGRSARNHDPLADQTDDIQTVVLAPGTHAHSTLTYLGDSPADCGGAAPFRPATILVTPPGAAAPIGIAWHGGSVDDCHGGATHPGTYIGAIHRAPPGP